MSDNAFVRAYGLAPPPEEEWVAPPPVEQVAPPGNAFVEAYGLAPPPPQQAAPSPSPQPVGYRPPDAYETGPAPAPSQQTSPPQVAAPPPLDSGQRWAPDNRPIWERTADDLGNAVEEFVEQPSWKDRGGQVLGASTIIPRIADERTEQRLLDRIETGNPDFTLGGMGLDKGIQGVWDDPSTLLDLPAAIGEVKDHPEVLFDSMTQDVRDSEGTLSREGLTEWGEKNPQKVLDAAAQGDGAILQAWKEDTGRTLDSAGIPGALSGLGSDILADPQTLISTGINAAARLGAKGLVLAGQEGLAGNVLTKAEPLAQTFLDPVGMMAETGLRKLAGKLTLGGTNRSATAMEGRVTGAVEEVLGTNTASLRAAAAADAAALPPVTQTTAPQSVPAPTNGPVPSTPFVPQTTPQIASQPINGSAPPSPTVAPPTAPLAPPPTLAAPQPARQPLNLYPPRDTSAGTPFGGRPATQATPAGKLPLLMRDGSRPQGSRWVHPNGQPPTKATLHQGWKAIIEAPPEAIKPFKGDVDVLPGEDTVFTQYLAAMTEQGHLYNDWPVIRPGGKEFAAQRQAGQAWTRLFSERIGKPGNHGAPEVQRLADEYQAQQSMPFYRDDPRKSTEGYWKWRAESIIEAAEKAEFDAPFVLTRGGKPYPYTPKGGAGVNTSPIRGAGSLVQNAPQPVITNPLQATLDQFSTADKATRISVGWNLQRLMDSPEGFTPGGKFDDFRSRMYRSGAWSKTIDKPDAYARYQAIRNTHAGKHSEFPIYHPAYRKSSATPLTTGRLTARPAYVSPTLTPQERQTAEGLAAEFRAHLNAMGLGRVRLGMVDAVTNPSTGLRQADLASFDPETSSIDLAVGRTYETVVDEIVKDFGPGWSQKMGPEELAFYVKRGLYQSVNHESVHALREAGVIRPDEWDVLVREARARKYGAWADEAYGEGDAALRDEEAVAEMFGDFASDAKVLSGVTRTIFQRVIDFFSGMVRAIGRVPNGSDVMKKMLSGDVGGRSPRPVRDTSLMAQRYTGEVYHGTGRTELAAVSADPNFAGRNQGTPASRLGAFFSSNPHTAWQFGPNVADSTLYRASLDLENPAEMSWEDYLHIDGESVTPGEIDAIRQRLVDAGHDGIIFHDAAGKPLDLVTFNDVPVQRYWGEIKKPTKSRRGSMLGAIQRTTGLGKKGTALGNMDNTLITEENPLYAGRVMTNTEMRFLEAPLSKEEGSMTLREVNAEAFDEVEELRNLAHVKATSSPANPFPPSDAARLNALKKKYDAYDPRHDWSDPAFTPDEANRIVVAHATKRFNTARYPKGDAPPATAGGGVLQVVKDWTAFRRVMGLTSITAAPQQAVRQLFGNVMTALIAKPSAAFGQIAPGTHLKIYRGARDKSILTDHRAFLKARGRGDPSTLDTASKSLSKHNVAIQNPTLKRLQSIFGPRWVADLVSNSDGVNRDVIHRVSYVSDMRKEIEAAPKMGSDVYAAYLGNYKDTMPVIYPHEVEKVIADVTKKLTFEGEPFSRVTGQDLKDALITEFKGRAGEGTDAAKYLKDFADRVGRNLNTADNLHSQLAGKEVDRVAYPWENSNLDEGASNLFLYLYWTSRASFLYAKEMAKKPWMAAAFMNLTEQLVAEGEEHNYPEWMKGYTRILNTPVGLSLLANPMDALSTILVGAEWQYGEDFAEAMKGDISALGAFRNTFLPVMAPIFDFGAYVAGLYGGEDARMPSNLTGLDTVFRRGAQILNGLGYAGNLPFGMGQDANGQFRPFPEMPMAELAMKASVFLGRQPVDLYAGITAKRKFHLEQILIGKHPEWTTSPQGEDELIRTVNDMMKAAEAGDVAPDVYEAERRAQEEGVTGPSFESVPEAIRGVFGGALRALSPIRILTEPELKTQLRAGTVPVGTKDSYDVSSLKGAPYDTLEAALASQAVEDYYLIGEDTGINDAARVYDAIAHANIEGVIKVGGFSYTKASLVDGVMTESQRYDVADKYLETQGLTKTQLDDYRVARDAAEAANPDVGGYLEFQKYAAREYSGGLPAFVDAAVRTSPSYARYMQRTGLTPGTPEYYAKGDSPDAFFAIEGRRSGIYDPTTLPDTGTIPGMAAGSTFAMKRALEENADAAAARSSGGDGDTYEEFVGDVEQKVNNLYYAQYWIDQTFPGSGLQAGVYINNKYGAYDTMKAVWEANGVYVPKEGDISYEYREWLKTNATAPEHNVKAFLDQREQTGPGKSADMPPATADMFAEQGGYELVTSNASPKRTASGAMDTAGMTRVTPNQEIWMRTGPSTANPGSVVVYAGMTMFVTDRQGDWAQVVAPGDQVGWIPSAALNLS